MGVSENVWYWNPREKQIRIKIVKPIGMETRERKRSENVSNNFSFY